MEMSTFQAAACLYFNCMIMSNLYFYGKMCVEATKLVHGFESKLTEWTFIKNYFLYSNSHLWIVQLPAFCYASIRILSKDRVYKTSEKLNSVTQLHMDEAQN